MAEHSRDRDDAAKYPSGYPMPKYGPSTDDEFIVDGLEWAYAMLLARDQMNAAVHCVSVRLSPVTVSTRTALGLFRTRLAAGVGEQQGGQHG